MSYLYSYLSAYAKQKFLKSTRLFYRLFPALIVLLVCANFSHASAPAGYSEYYIPGDEDNMNFILGDLDTATPAPNTMHAVITVTAWSDNTTVYYDHWEDGYDFDPANPGTADETVTLVNAGDQKVFESSGMTIPRSTSLPYYYDGGDRIYVAGGTVTVTRTSWVDGRGVGNQGVAWEIYPVKPQLTTYVLPFGENLGFADFSRVYVLIQATEDNTTFTVDLDADGTPDILNLDRNNNWNTGTDSATVTLQRGETFLLDRISACRLQVNCTTAPSTLNTGAIIQGSKTLQVKFIAGAEDNLPWIARGFSVFPRGFWTKDYYAPLGNPTGGENTDYYLYNPNTSAITVTWESQTTSGSFSIPANTTVSFRTAAGGAVPTGSGLYFKGTDIFWGVGSNNIAGTNTGYYEWGYSLLPSTMLYKEHFLGWAPGYDVTNGAQAVGEWNNVGVFITAAQDNTNVFIDYDNDGTADQTYTLDRLQTQYVYDTVDGNLSQAHIWATGNFSMVYGENADLAPNQQYGMDIGYVAIPGSDFVSLVLTVDKSVSPQIVPTASNSSATFTLTVNSQKYTVDNVRVMDMLPANWQYVGPTSITLPDMTTVTTAPTVTAAGAALPAPFSGNCPTGGGACLTWGDSLLGNMAENQKITITFTAETTTALAVGTLSQNRVKAIGTRTFGSPSQTQTFTTTDFVYVTSGDMQDTDIEKTSSATGPLYPGDQFTYTVTVTNPASAAADLTGISIYDPLPAGVSYVAGSSQVTGWLVTTQADDVRDNFGTQAYDNNDGSVSWAVNWVESDATQDPAAGNVLVTGGELRLGATSNIYRQVDLSAATSATLSLNYSTSGNVDNGEWAYIEVASSISGPWTTVYSFQNDQTGSVTNFNIPSGLLSSTTAIRIRTTGYDAGEYLYIDNVDISYTYPVTASGTYPGGDAPNFVSSSDGYFAAPGNSLTLTYDVIVDNPLAAGIEEITNTAYVNSNEIILPLSASVSNIVVNPSSGSSEVGDRVWLDSDSDGVLDVGEPGLANVEVTLKDQFGTPLMTTTTDGTGHYLFAGVIPGNDYYVEATSGTIPSGLQQSAPTGHTDHRTDPFNLINLVSLGNNRDQFGSANYNNSDGTVSWTANSWVETDGVGGGAGGGEIRITGGELRLNNDTSGTAPRNSVLRPLSIPPGATMATLSFDWRTTGLETTDSIIFDISSDGSSYTALATFTNLTSASSGSVSIDISPYLSAGTTIRFRVAAGYTQTDDLFFVDNVNIEYYSQTVVDSYLKADLGYTSAPGKATIGDYVWSDANADNRRNGGEAGIAGVTVELWRDVNGDGIKDAGDALCTSVTCGVNGTTTTAPDGSYLFSGVTAGGTEDYIVYIYETQAALSGYTRTSPPSGDALFSIIDISSGASIMYANFGYQGTAYSVKDQLWFDTGNYGIMDSGEPGISGVTVDLLDASLNVIATTTTASDGTFAFTGVKGGGANYTIKISDTGGKLTDYFGTTAGAQSGSLQVINLSGDVNTPSPPSFGYNLSRAIGDTVFNDNGAGGGTLADGIQDGSEPGIPGVTIQLYRGDSDNVFEPGGDDGDPVATLVTDTDGRYLFSGLSTGTYWVHIDNTQTALIGYSRTTAADQLLVTMSGSTNLGIDFGYRASTPGSISGVLWEDNANYGVRDSGEPGIPGVTIDLYIDSNGNGVYDQGTDALVASTSSSSYGSYSFNGIPSDNLYYVRITDNDGVLTGYTPTWEKTELLTSPFNGQESVTLNSDVTGVDFGYITPIPTLVVLSYFGAFERNGEVIVKWETGSEFDTLGFNLMRLDPVTGEYKQVNSGLLPAMLRPHRGGRYTLKDTGAAPGNTYTYKLFEVEVYGNERAYGPFTVFTGKKKDIKRADRSLGPDYTREERVQPQPHKTRMGGRKTIQQPNAVATVGDRIKISVTDAGIYYVDAGTVSSLLGIPLEEVSSLISSGQLSLSSRGKQVAYLPAPDAAAGMYFYAKGIDNVYTKENIYWIDRGAGTLMRVVHGPGPQPVTGEGSFADTVHFEQDLAPWETLFNDPNADYWFWSQIFSSNYYTDAPWSYTFTVPRISGAESTATLKVNLYGGSDTGIINEHHVAVSLNGNPIAEEWWSGITAHTITATSQLGPGENTITVKSMADPGVSSSFVLINSFDVTYQRLFEAEGDRLFFRGDGAQTVTVGGFSSPDIMVFNITHPFRPILKTATSVGAESATYTVSLDPASAGTSYVAVAAGGIQNAAAAAVVTSPLSLITNAADYIVIAPADLISTAQALADYRAGQGLRTMVVSLEDIMNEFNFGIWGPEAIRKFLRYARNNWSAAPRHVVLAGDGSMDFKDNMGLGGSLLPSKMVPTPYGLAMSDNYLADVNGDHMPEFAIGRLPVGSPDELETVINKIKTYERNIGNKRVVLTADTPDEGGDFIAESEILAGLFSTAYEINKIYLDKPSLVGEKKAALISAINGGTAFFNFTGHAGPDQLSNYGLFSYYPDDIPPVDDLSLLTNADILPVMTAMTCGLANFSDPYEQVLGEALLLKPDGGTAATWSATGLSDDARAAVLSREFYKAVVSGKKATLGDAVRQALSMYKKQDPTMYMMDIYCILGDPALRIR